MNQIEMITMKINCELDEGEKLLLLDIIFTGLEYYDNPNISKAMRTVLFNLHEDLGQGFHDYFGDL